MTIAPDTLLELLRCPATCGELLRDGEGLKSQHGERYRIDDAGIPLLAEHLISDAGRTQRDHYDRVASAYVENLGYPHTQEYMSYLDRMLDLALPTGRLGRVAEICCGRGEAFALYADRVDLGIGVDISTAMLHEARRQHPAPHLHFVQGDATRLPLAGSCLDTVFMLGGIHHVPDREKLFNEVSRVLRPGGRFIFREPFSDFMPWRALRWIVYRISPALDAGTERPLLSRETLPVLAGAHLRVEHWTSHGFLGFCLLMNSDILVFNRLLRFLPGIRSATRVMAWLDETALHVPGLRRAGLQVIGVAVKP